MKRCWKKMKEWNRVGMSRRRCEGSTTDILVWYAVSVSGQPRCSYTDAKHVRGHATPISGPGGPQWFGSESIREPGIRRKSVNGSGTPKGPKKRYSELCNGGTARQNTTARRSRLPGCPAHRRMAVAHVPALHFVPSAVSGQYRRYALVCNTPVSSPKKSSRFVDSIVGWGL